MNATQFNVSKHQNAGPDLGGFVSVSAEINGKTYGADIWDSGEVTGWDPAGGNGGDLTRHVSSHEIREAAFHRVMGS